MRQHEDSRASFLRSPPGVILSAGAVSGIPTRRSYMPELDGIRAIAISMVMVFHLASSNVPIPGPVILGQSGVDLFFVLSGFLITGILLKARQNDWHEVRTFYLRRALRIFPLYYFVLIVVWTWLLHDRVSWDVWSYLQNMTLAFGYPMHGPMHFWSLAVEEQFYLVWPFLVMFLPRRYLGGVLGAMIAFAVLCRLPLLHAGISVFYFTFTRMDALAIGAVLALVQTRTGLAKHRRTMIALLAVSAVLLLGSAAIAHASRAAVQVVKYTAFATFYASCVGLVLISHSNPLTRLLRSSPLRFVGRISYGLYVFHPLVFALLIPRILWMPVPMRALSAILATFACALLSWYGMEKHFIALKDRIAPERAMFPAEAPRMTAI